MTGESFSRDSLIAKLEHARQYNRSIEGRILLELLASSFVVLFCWGKLLGFPSTVFPLLMAVIAAFNAFAWTQWVAFQARTFRFGDPEYRIPLRGVSDGSQYENEELMMALDAHSYRARRCARLAVLIHMLTALQFVVLSVAVMYSSFLVR